MLPALARIEDLAVRLGVAGDEIDDARAQAALDDASTLVRAEVNKTWVVDILADPVVLLPEAEIPDIVGFVVLAAAKRGYENPSGITQKTAGDVSMTFAARPQSAVYLTDDERALLNSAVFPSTSGLHTVATYRGDLACDTVWIPVVGAPPFPWLTTEDMA